MKVLSIGNSFSQDAHRYLHRFAKHHGTEMKAVNLYIGGCTLRRHYLNLLENRAEYVFEFNGEPTGIYVSIRQALASDDWDVVTLQQASPNSIDFETYTPYLEEIAATVRQYCPHARLLIHQTWAYEDGSERLYRLFPDGTSRQMLAAISSAYDRAVVCIHADGLIPAGDAMMAAHELGIEKVHRDTFHASRGVGRYLLALCWYRALTGKEILTDDFGELDVPMSEGEREIAIRAVDLALVGRRYNTNNQTR